MIAVKDLMEHLYLIKNLNMKEKYEKSCKKSVEQLWNKKSWWARDLQFQSDTFLLEDVFECFRNKCIERHELELNQK